MSMGETVAEEYASSLHELVANHKPSINMLTMLADEEVEHAAHIVSVVENHIAKVPPERKLPALYLIDSIVKNCANSPYKELFQKDIVKIFVRVFEQVDERTRTQLYKLRCTWANIFSPARLYSIDLKVNSVDPNWPIVCPTPKSNTNNVINNNNNNPGRPPAKQTPHPHVHVNPKFFKESSETGDDCEKVRLRELEREKKELEDRKNKMIKDMAPKVASVVIVPDRDPRKKTTTNNSSSHVSDHFRDPRSKKRRSDSRDSSLDRGRKNPRKSKSPDRNSKKSSKEKKTSSGDGKKDRALPLKKRKLDAEMGEQFSSSGSEIDLKKPSDEETKRKEAMKKLLEQSPPRVENDSPQRMKRIPKIKKEPAPYDPKHRGDVDSRPAFSRGLPRQPPTSSTNALEATVQPGAHAFEHAFELSPQRTAVMTPLVMNARNAGLLPAPALQQQQPFMPVNTMLNNPGYLQPSVKQPLLPNGPNMSAPAVFNQPSAPQSEPIPANNRIYVNGRAYEVQYIEETAVIERDGLPHKIYFSGPPRDVVIDGVAHNLRFGDTKEVVIDGQTHFIKFGAPSKELFMGKHAFRGAFGGPAIFAMINGKRYEIRLGGPPPEVKIDPEPCYELLRHMRNAPHYGPTGFAYDYGSSLAPPSTPITQVDLPPQEAPAPAQTDVNTLLDNLLRAGVLSSAEPAPPPKVTRNSSYGNLVSSSRSPVRPPTPPIPSQHGLREDSSMERRDQPPLSLKEFSMRSLQIRYASVVDSLYSTMLKSCPHCGLRFDDTQSNKFATHLDYHFQQNNKSADSRAISRPWFLVLDDWIEQDDAEGKSKSAIFEAKAQADAEANLVNCEPTVEDDSGGGKRMCAVCDEEFESFHDEDEDVWKLKNAVVVNAGTEDKVCHPLCAQDLTINPTPAPVSGEANFFSVLEGGSSGAQCLPGLNVQPTSDPEGLVLRQHLVKTEQPDLAEETGACDELRSQESAYCSEYSLSSNYGDKFVKTELPDEFMAPVHKRNEPLPAQIVQAIFRAEDYSDDEDEHQSPGTPLRDESHALS